MINKDNIREYEIFKDIAYYDMWCVRDTSNKSFNSRTNWHFALKADANKFLELLNKSK